MKRNFYNRLFRFKKGIFSPILILLLLLVSMSGTAQTVTTNKSDYMPGEYVIITGTGWLAGETVNMVINHQIFNHPDQNLFAIADANGKIFNDNYIIALTDLGESFLLTATGQTSGSVASVVFTDAAGNFSKPYAHWSDEPLPGDWNNNILNDNKSNYFEGEVIPHVYMYGASNNAQLVNGQSYSFNVTYNWYQANTDAGGFAYMTQYNLSRQPNVFDWATPASPPAEDNSFTNGGGMAAGASFYTVDADITNISAVTTTGTGTKDGHVTITFIYTGTTTSNGYAAIYYGLYVAKPGEVPDQGAGKTNGANAWSGGSLQTTVDIGGSGATSIQLAPSAIIPGEISGLKFSDLSHNGTKDSNEPGLAGWTICLDSDSNPNNGNLGCVLTSNGTTDDQDGNGVIDPVGFYYFSVTPGTYYVHEVNQEGWTMTMPANGYYGPLEVSPTATSYINQNFGNYYCLAPNLNDASLTVCENIQGGELDGTFDLTSANVGIDGTMTVAYNVPEGTDIHAYNALNGTQVTVTAYTTSLNDPTCFDQATITLNVNPRPELSVTPLYACSTVEGENTAVFDLTSAFSYSGGTATITSSVNGDITNANLVSYTGVNSEVITVTVTGPVPTNCVTTKSFNITVYSHPHIDVLEISHLLSWVGAHDGAINLEVSGGTPFGTPAEPYKYAWTGPDGFTAYSEDISGLYRGIYSVTVTDANGCTTTGEITLEPPAGSNIKIDATPILCYYNSGYTDNGSVTVTITGPYSFYRIFNWTGPDGFSATTYDDVTHIDHINKPGIYKVIINFYNDAAWTDLASVSEELQAEVTAPSNPLTVDAGTNKFVCYEDNAVTLTADASGGTGTLSYKWFDEEPDAESVSIESSASLSVSPAPPGKTYWVVVTDENLCSVTDEVAVTVNPAISVSVDDEAVCYGEDVTFTATAEGGTGNYTFEWKVGDVVQEGVTGNALTLNDVIADASITVKVSDDFVPSQGATACTDDDGANLDVNPAISVSVDDEAVCYGEDVTFTATAEGGTGNYTFEWKVGDVVQEGVTGNTLTLNDVIADASITVKVSDDFVPSQGATACTDDDGANLDVNPAISVTMSDQTVCEMEDVTFTANASGGTGILTYVWSVNGTSQSPTTSNTLTLNDVLANVTISVTVSDEFESSQGATICTALGNASLTVEPCSWISLKKTTNGVVNPDMTWSFKLSEGVYPDLTELASQTTSGVTDGILFENVGPLSLQKAYTVCELGVPAGYGTKWYIDPAPGGTPDGVFDPIGYTFYPGTGGVFNINAFDQPPQDLGNRCYQINVGQLPANTYETRTPALNASILKFEVDNTFPGGDPRTPGYWKNWNTCTGGGQEHTATNNATDKNGDGVITAYDRVNSGWALLDDIIELTPITWGSFVLDQGDCVNAQLILDNRDLSGVNRSSDPAYTLAKHLLAYQLNQGAGAHICFEMTAVMNEAIQLLVGIPFDGIGYDLYKPNTPTLKAKASRALELAKILDAYNNGISCEELAKMITPTPIPPAASLSCSTSVINVTTFGGTNGSITVTATGGNPAYQYRLGTSGALQSSNFFGGLKAGTYTIIVKDANAATCSCNATVTQPKKVTKSAEIATVVSSTTTDESTIRVYPNPFTERLNIEFSSATDTWAQLEIYSITGSKLETLFNGPVSRGVMNTVEYIPRLVGSQILFYHLTLNGKNQIGKLIYNERR